MMNRLNIPLSRSRKTTHRSRWVVWLLAIIMILGVLLVGHFTSMWFTRNTVFLAAPESTQTALKLTVNKKTWPVLNRILSSVPLISNRSLSIKDVLPYTEGEIGWFINKDNSRSLAIRTQSNKIPKDLLDSQHIVFQEISPNLFLLSEKLQPISGIKTKRALSRWIPSLKTRVGEFYDQESGWTTQIYSTKNGISIDLATKDTTKSTFDTKRIPSDPFLVLSTPVLPSIFDHIHIYQFDNFVNPLIGNPLKDLFSSLLSGKGVIVQDNNGSFLLASDTFIKDTDRMRLLQTALVLKNPEVQTKILQDRTSVQELIADPTTISVEERAITGKEFYRASSGLQSLLLSKAGEFILSDNEEMIRTWLNKEEKTKNVLSCEANIAFLDIQTLFGQDTILKNYYDATVLRSLFLKFNAISLNTQGNHVVFNICF